MFNDKLDDGKLQAQEAADSKKQELRDQAKDQVQQQEENLLGKASAVDPTGGMASEFALNKAKGQI